MKVLDEFSNLSSNFEDFLKDKRAFIWKLVFTCAVLIYLLCITTGQIDANNRRLEVTEIGLIAIVLLVNSNIFDRLQEFQFGKEGFDVKLDNKLQANIGVNQKEAAALIYLGQILLGDKEEEQKTLFDFLLNDGDKDLLEQLWNAEDKNQELWYEKSEIEVCLERLCALGLIQTIQIFTKDPINFIPEKGNLREYFKLSDTGKKCLAYGSSAIQPAQLGLLG